MTQDAKYKQILASQINKIKEDKTPVLIFGAGRAGWYIIKVLEHFGISISGIIDNDKNKYGLYFNYPVNSSLEMTQKFPNSKLFLGLFAPNTAKIVEAQLQQYEFNEISFNMESFLFSYFIDVAGRKCNETILAESIKILFENYSEGVDKSGYNSKLNFVSPSVTGYVTQRCTLKCKDCGGLIPYYKNPITFSVDDVVSDIEQYAKAFDVVPEISLSGGEPFLNSNFHIICEKISAIPNIVFINFTTNGTIVPSEDKLVRIAACGADIHQSDYGKLSTKQNELLNLFNKHNIYNDINFVNDNHMWFPRPMFSKQNRKDETNDKIFQECIASNKFCAQIMAGELHRCPTSLNGTHQGLHPTIPEDFVDLQNKKKNDAQISEEIRALLTRDNAINVCDYCNLNEAEYVPPAVQLAKNS